MFIDPTITWVPSGSLDTYGLTQKLCLKKTLHTLGNFEFNTPLQPFQFIPCMTHLTNNHFANLFLQFFNDKIERIRSKFPSSDSPIPIFFQSFLHIYLISIQPLSRKFIISFLLLNVIHLIKSAPCLNLYLHFHTRDICRIFPIFPLYV